MGTSDDYGNNEERAEARTDWAEDRTIMANERTFNSWMGFGLGGVGVALGLKAVFGEFEPTWAAKAVATGFLAISIFIYWTAQRKAHKTYDRLSNTTAEPVPSKNFRLLALLMTIATIGVGAILWSL